MGAKMMDIPELELTKDEAEKFTRAIKEVAKHYDYSMDPKKVAMFQLLCVAGGIYGPRGMAIYRRSQSAEKQRPKLVQINRAAAGGTTDSARVPNAERTAPAPPAPAEKKAPQVPSQMDMSPLVDGFNE